MTDRKHTPEPWVFNQVEMKVKGSGDTQGLTIIANVSPNMDYSRGMFTQCANAQRIVECVNALAGIPNPAEWVEYMKKYDKNPEYIKILDQIDLDKLNFEGLWKREKEFNAQLQSENERLKSELELHNKIIQLCFGGGGGKIEGEGGKGGSISGGTIHPNIIDETPKGK